MLPTSVLRRLLQKQATVALSRFKFTLDGVAPGAAAAERIKILHLFDGHCVYMGRNAQ